MITREQADKIRDELLSVLAEDAHNTQRLTERLESITRESGIGAHAALLLILTHKTFTEEEARRHWEAIVARHKELSDSLGRTPGIRVALLDHFMNVNRQWVQPVLIELELMELNTREATRDRLTGLANDHTFRTALQQELRRARRYDQKAAVVIFDLDNFAQINDRFGRLVGDRIMRETGILLSNKIRDIDIAARPGEDEIALLLPETDRAGALLVAERYRQALETHFARRESAGQTADLTTSGGVACYPEDATTPAKLMERAAQALYQAKALGKNMVEPYQPERRRFLRFQFEPGRFEVEVLSPPTPGAGGVRNLSSSGILFTSPEPLEVGEEIEIRVADPGEDPEARSLRVRGRVVRLEELPGQAQAEAVVDDDRFEIGMAFDLDWSGETDDMTGFLHAAQALGHRS